MKLNPIYASAVIGSSFLLSACNNNLDQEINVTTTTELVEADGFHLLNTRAYHFEKEGEPVAIHIAELAVPGIRLNDPRSIPDSLGAVKLNLRGPKTPPADPVPFPLEDGKLPVVDLSLNKEASCQLLLRTEIVRCIVTFTAEDLHFEEYYDDKLYRARWIIEPKKDLCVKRFLFLWLVSGRLYGSVSYEADGFVLWGLLCGRRCLQVEGNLVCGLEQVLSDCRHCQLGVYQIDCVTG